jgi:hypothetical protein
MELKEFAKSADGALRIITTLWKMKQSRKRGKEMGNNCNCKHNHNSNSDEPCCRCDSKQTNADRIRNMPDKELAEFLITFKNTFGEEYEGEASCMDWLQSEAE